MATHDEQALVATAEAARLAPAAGRAGADQSSEPSAIRRGVIASVDAGSTYTVDVRAANGSTAETLPGLRVWGGLTLAVDARVILIFEGDRPLPYIFAAGGGTGSALPTIVGNGRFFS